jgi:hypothetical protein
MFYLNRKISKKEFLDFSENRKAWENFTYETLFQILQNTYISNLKCFPSKVKEWQPWIPFSLTDLEPNCKFQSKLKNFVEENPSHPDYIFLKRFLEILENIIRKFPNTY